jgi:DNA-binding CsgD family transcriptional regulator
MDELSSADLHAFIDLLYGSVLDESMLHEAIGSLGQAMGDRRVMLLNWSGSLADTPTIVSTRSAQGRTFQAFIADYGAYYHQLDPAKPKWPLVQESSWMHEDREADPLRWRRSEFHQDFALSQGVVAWSCLKIIESRSAQQSGWAVTFMRDAGGAPMSATALRQVETLLAPHLARALTLRETVTRLREQAQGGLAALDHCDYPIWLVELSGEVRFANTAADAYLRGPSPVVGVQAGLLKPRDARAAAEWPAFLAQRSARAKGEAAAISLQQADGAQVVLRCLALSAQAAAAADWQRPLRMVVINDRSRRPGGGALLRALYGLTPAEVRVGQLLLEDLTPAEIGQRCDTRTETVRGQIKSILRKTDCRRQAELVRLLISLAVFRSA